MLSFVQSWFTPSANPVGVDFGTDWLRLAQVEKVGGEFRLIASACAEVPEAVRGDPTARLTFFSRTLRELWSRGNFRGRRAVLALPAANMHVQHLRLPRMDDASLAKAIPWEARGKLPIDPSQALIRHIVAGDVYCDNDPHSEVILMAAGKTFVEDFLAAATKARLEVTAMTVEPKAIIDCFLNVYGRRSDISAVNCFIDIGSAASRVVIAQGAQILFVRYLPIGGEHFNAALAKDSNISNEKAKRIRFDEASAATTKFDLSSRKTPDENTADRGAPREQGAAPHGDRRSPTREETPEVFVPVNSALTTPLRRLTEELALCRRYHESTFPNHPVQRLIFVGGEAHQRGLCQAIARELGIAAQIGDPLVRMRRTAEISPANGIDISLPQPAWAMAIGLSMGARVHETTRV